MRFSRAVWGNQSNGHSWSESLIDKKNGIDHGYRKLKEKSVISDLPAERWNENTNEEKITDKWTREISRHGVLQKENDRRGLWKG